MKTKLEYDVVIIGGGPAGALAAIAAGRNNARTLLVEQYGYLGGALTACGTGPQMTYHAGSTQVVRGIPDELVNRMIKEGFSPGHMEDFVGYASSVTPFDAEGLKLVLENMVREAGVEILYHTVYTGCETEFGKIKSVNLYSKNGFFNAAAGVFIDASADADLAVHAGVDAVYGEEGSGLAQPMTMNMKLYGVDRDAVIDFVINNKNDMLPTIPFEKLRLIPRTGIQGGYSVIRKARDEGRFTVDRGWLLCFETNNPGEFIINMSRMAGKSAVDAFDLSAAEMEGRRQCYELFRFLKDDVPGFKNARIHSTGPNIGIRESRKINGVYKLTAKDLINNTMFDDAVAMGGYPIDIHPVDGKEPAPEMAFDMGEYTLRKGSWYSIPYRSLIAYKAENLVVTGRCISVSHEALGAVRVTPLAMALGQAAGTAAALAAGTGGSTLELDTAKLRETLIHDGAFLEAYAR